MAKFDVTQAVAVAAIQQLINDWAFELDIHNGQHIGDLITEDCTYAVGPTPRQGRAEVKQFYADRLIRLGATPAGVPIQRHVISTLRVDFQSTAQASITFTLIYFTTAGMDCGTEHAGPAAVADVRMKVRQEADGDWRIAAFDSNQTFRRVIP